MVRGLVQFLAAESDCLFSVFEQSNESFDFYTPKNLSYKRFLVIYETPSLIPPQELNELILEETPLPLLQDPSFAKNTDVVVLLKVSDIEDVRKLENEIFAIEEDNFSFKKHVLYYSKYEEENLQLLELNDANSLNEMLLNENFFKEYKSDPYSNSAYAVVSRLFIKLPFVSVPVMEELLEDPLLIAQQELEGSGLNNLVDTLEGLLETGMSHDKAVKEYIRGKMENQ